MKYLEIYKDWKDNPIEFWKKNAEDVSWIKFPENILTKKNENFYNSFIFDLEFSFINES